MADTLILDRILDYYDLPQLFVARDAFQTLYLCLLYADDVAPSYTAIRISPDRLQGFLKGQADLRSLFQTPEKDGEYFDVVFTDSAYNLTPAPFSVIPEDRLPEEGYVMSVPDTETVRLSVPSADTGLLLNLARKFGWACVF